LSAPKDLRMSSPNLAKQRPMLLALPPYLPQRARANQGFARNR
jgi:hypothetical protein